MSVLSKADLRFIDASDLHLRDDRPICRADEDWVSAQLDKVSFICAAAKRFKVPVVCSGDIFDRWNCSLDLVGRFIDAIKGTDWLVVAGQHDLPHHSVKLVGKSALGVVLKAGYCTLLNRKVVYRDDKRGTSFMGVSFGEELPENVSADVLVIHKFLYEKTAFPGAPARGRTRLLLKDLCRARAKFRMVVSGDNHETFLTTGDKGIIIHNPGSLSRQTIDQKDFRPSIGKVQFCEGKFKVDLLSVPIFEQLRSNKTGVPELDKAETEKFISELGKVEVTEDFRRSVLSFVKNIKVSKRTLDILLKSLDEKKVDL
jgi:DNA repair exonuclease SbcCD nuclease subunit